MGNSGIIAALAELPVESGAAYLVGLVALQRAIVFIRLLKASFRRRVSLSLDALVFHQRCWPERILAFTSLAMVGTRVLPTTLDVQFEIGTP
jgi:hypothetical protein